MSDALMDCCLCHSIERTLLLATVLKALGPHQYYDSGDEYVADEVPLLKYTPHPYVVDQGYGHGPKNDSWIRNTDKVVEDHGEPLMQSVVDLRETKYRSEGKDCYILERCQLKDMIRKDCQL